MTSQAHRKYVSPKGSQDTIPCSCHTASVQGQFPQHAAHHLTNAGTHSSHLFGHLKPLLPVHSCTKVISPSPAKASCWLSMCVCCCLHVRSAGRDLLVASHRAFWGQLPQDVEHQRRGHQLAGAVVDDVQKRVIQDVQLRIPLHSTQPVKNGRFGICLQVASPSIRQGQFHFKLVLATALSCTGRGRGQGRTCARWTADTGTQLNHSAALQPSSRCCHAEHSLQHATAWASCTERCWGAAATPSSSCCQQQETWGCCKDAPPHQRRPRPQ